MKKRHAVRGASIILAIFCPRNLPLKGGGLNMVRRTQLNALQALEAAEAARVRKALGAASVWLRSSCLAFLP